jgi:hypothetical protein
MDRDREADFELSRLDEEISWVLRELSSGGYRFERAEICGYLLKRSHEHRHNNRLLLVDPFERGRRYLVLAPTDRKSHVVARGWISGSEILRHGKPVKVGGRSGHFIERKRLNPVPEELGNNLIESWERILEEKYMVETGAVGGLLLFMGYPLPPPKYDPEFDSVRLGQAEVAGFIIRASSETKTEGEEVFLHDPLEPNSRYAAVFVPEDRKSVYIYGWILGRDAVRLGRPSETEWGGVWVKRGDMNKLSR